METDQKEGLHSAGRIRTWLHLVFPTSLLFAVWRPNIDSAIIASVVPTSIKKKKKNVSRMPEFRIFTKTDTDV